MPDVDDLAEQAGRRHADRVAGLLSEFSEEEHDAVLAIGVETVAIACARIITILRETAPPEDIKGFCDLFVAAYNAQLATHLWRPTGKPN